MKTGEAKDKLINSASKIQWEDLILEFEQVKIETEITRKIYVEAGLKVEEGERRIRSLEARIKSTELLLNRLVTKSSLIEPKNKNKEEATKSAHIELKNKNKKEAIQQEFTGFYDKQNKPIYIGSLVKINRYKSGPLAYKTEGVVTKIYPSESGKEDKLYIKAQGAENLGLRSVKTLTVKSHHA